MENIDVNLLDLSEPVLMKTLLFCSNSFDINANTNVLNATIKCSEEPLFEVKRFSNNVIN